MWWFGQKTLIRRKKHVLLIFLSLAIGPEKCSTIRRFIAEHLWFPHLISTSWDPIDYSRLRILCQIQQNTSRYWSSEVILQIPTVFFHPTTYCCFFCCREWAPSLDPMIQSVALHNELRPSHSPKLLLPRLRKVGILVHHRDEAPQMLVSVDGFHLFAEAPQAVSKRRVKKRQKKMAGKAKRKSDKISVANLLVDFLQVTLFQRFNSQSQGKPALFSGFLKQGTPPKPHSGTPRYHSSYGKGIRSSHGPERLAVAT